MKLLDHLLSTDPAAPRLTVYNETTGARLDFSAQTLDNWASKIANMLIEELDLTPGQAIAVDLPASWQAAVTVLGALAARIEPQLIDAEHAGSVAACFTTLERHDAWAAKGVETVLVSKDPFGRGIEESGGELPDDSLDFGPIVRFYGDQYFGDAPRLDEAVTPTTAERVLAQGWETYEQFTDAVLAPLAAGGSSVIVTGTASTERIAEIAENEKVTLQISPTKLL